ncbi:MAG: MotA/TolQ/ExbB proton channel family protein [Planctomycetes bacterium]|nr:MotA/TolQ/ExbB proton channel family protein [Planctomycetota bacterium]
MNRMGWVLAAMLAATVVAVGLTMAWTPAVAGEGEKEKPGTVEVTPKKAEPEPPGPAEREPAPERSTSLLAQLNKGGVIGWIIMALSPVALALIIEHSVTLRRDKMCPPELVQELNDFFNEEQYEEALELCNVERNFLTNTVRAGLARLDAGFEAMQQGMTSAAEEEFTNYQLRISWLSLIGNVAPMMGLLGTVQGMIGAFGKIAEMTVVKPSVLAGNINVALVTTFQGLTVAIPVMCAYQYIANRIVSNVLASGNTVSELMDRFRGKK